MTLDRTVDSGLPFKGVSELGRSERGGVAGLEGSVADRSIDAWSRTASGREPSGSERYLWQRCWAPRRSSAQTIRATLAASASTAVS